MSERTNPTLNVEGSAARRSLAEQHALMEAYDTERYEAGLDEAAYNEAIAKRENEMNTRIEERILDNPKARRMYMMAQHIAELRSSSTSPEVIADKEAKLEELLIEYADEADSDRAVEYTNASQERSTPKGERIRINKQIDAEEARAERRAEIDFILDATEGVATAGSSVETTANASDDDSSDKDTIPTDEPEGNSETSAVSEKSSDDEFDQNDQLSLNELLENDGYDNEAQEGESLEEYEARHTKSDRIDISGTDLDDESKVDVHSAHIDTDGIDLDPIDDLSDRSDNHIDISGIDLDDEPTDTASEEAATTVPRSRRQRLRDVLTPAGARAEWDTLTSRSKDKLKRHKRLSIAIGAVAVVGLAYLMRDTGSSGSGTPNGGSGSFFSDLFPSPDIAPTPDSIPDASGPFSGNEAAPTNWSYPDGSGGEALMTSESIGTPVWYAHEYEFLQNFPNEAYLMENGHVGLLDQGGGPVSQLSPAAQAFWEQYRR